MSPELEDTYPFFSTYVDLAGRGYVEEEYYLSGLADGTHIPFDEAKLDALCRTHIGYVFEVARADLRNVRAGYLLAADAVTNLRQAWESDVGR